jgi:peptidoglycan/LPS O-acetylase OafA/YrhL
MPTSTAVWLFFIISGFYMQMILAGKYDGDIRNFYINRALRLYPGYFIALAFAVLVGGLGVFSTSFSLIPNLTLFGSDLVFFFGLHGRLLIGPAWSLGTELLFYLLAPFLAVRSIGLIVLLTTASLILRLWMEWTNPWSSYFFFPASFCFFGAGMIAQRAMLSPAARWMFSIRGLGETVAIVTLALLFAREFIPGFRNYPWMQCAVLAGGLPFIFMKTAAFEWDRKVGNISYPAYLLHEPMMTALAPIGLVTGSIVTLLTVIVAAIVNFTVESPIDGWRQRRAARSKVTHAASTIPIAPAPST